MNNFITEILKSKLIIAFAAFGAVFSLVLGLVARADPASLLIRAIIAAFIMAVMAAFIQLFLKKNLSEDDYNSLFNPGAVSSQDIPLRSGGGRIDVTDNSDVSADEIYSSASPSYSDDKPAPVVKKESAPSGSSGFQNMSFGSAAPIQESEPAPNPLNYQDETQEIGRAAASEARADDINAIKAAAAQAQTTGSGDIKIKMGNKVINTDSALIAKAIKTVLHKDS